MSNSKNKKENTSINSVHVDGNVTNSILIAGNKNKVIIQLDRIETPSTFFTILPPINDFIGREQALEQLRKKKKSGVNVVSISGGGGLGKTELARKFANEIKANYPDGQLNIDLFGLSDNPLSPEEVMRRLLEPFYPNQKLPEASEQLQGLYQKIFSTKKILLLLDNAENASQVRKLIPPSPSFSIITSRRNFSLTEFGLLEPLQLDNLSDEDSIEFLKNNSQKLKDSSDEELNQLAKLCGYLPLALRISVSVLNDRKDWSLNRLVENLADEHTRLKTLKRDDDSDLDIESAISLSYNQLDSNLKKRFRGLGVFNAPFVDFSAESVWDVNEFEANNTLGILVNHGLLTSYPSPIKDNQTGEILYEYTLHDLTRLFAISQLMLYEDEAKNAVIRHAYHFLIWAYKANNEYLKGGANILSGLSIFKYILHHLNSAYERLLPDSKHFPQPEKADEWLSEFPSMFINILDFYIPALQKIQIFNNSLNAARRVDNKYFEGLALNNLGIAYSHLGNFRQAIKYYDEYLLNLQKTDNLNGEASVYGNLGIAHASLGNLPLAITYFELSRQIHAKLGDRRGESNTLANLGNIFAEMKDTKKAIKYYKEALLIDREFGDRHGEGIELGNLGTAYSLLGELHTAVSYLQEQLKIVREIDDLRGEGSCLVNLGIAYKNLGDLEKATEFLQAALRILGETNDLYGIAHALSNLGKVYILQGKSEEAKQVWEQSHLIFAKIESPLAIVVKKWLEELVEIENKTTQKDDKMTDFIKMAIQINRIKSPKAKELFDLVSHIAIDDNAPLVSREICKVLRKILVGDKNPDLSNLPKDVAKLIKDELEK